MCGILGVVGQSPVNQLLYDGLQILQHRGQDAAGIVTASGNSFHMHKGSGMVRDVFRTRNMRSLFGHVGIGHVRYPTAGSASNLAEAQPFYVNSPYGIVLAHNGNLTNTDELKEEMFRQDLRHINTNSDSEVLLNVFAHELQRHIYGRELSEEAVFHAVVEVNRRVKGAYAVVAIIAGFGLVAFRDPNGIRPLVLGINRNGPIPEYMLASESVALDCLGFKLERDVTPGEAVVIRFDGTMTSRMCADPAPHTPCMFEYVYFASAAPAVRFPNVYGIDMPTRAELLATGRTEEEIAREIGADAVVYQDLDALKDAVHVANRDLVDFETSCFDGRYITGDIDEAYLNHVESLRSDASGQRHDAKTQGMLDMNLNVAEQNLI